MNILKFRPSTKSLALLMSCSALAACGGGGGGGGGIQVPPEVDGYIALSNTSSTGETPLGYVAITNTNATSSGFAGTLDHDTGTVRNGSLSGTIDGALTGISLANGNSATFTNPAGTTHVRIFTTNGLSNDLFGAIGQFTNQADKPIDGTSTYNGDVIMDAFNGSDSFALTGNATVNVGWIGAGDVDTVFTGLSGQKNDTQNVQNIGTVTINNATITGTSFSGGTFSTTGSDLAYSGGGNGEIEGQFFGPDATEVGGVFSLDAPSQIELSGVFIAKGGLN
jgi:hypothetical protein